MIYTICWEEKEIEEDIKVNREQKISETMSILREGGILPITDREEIQVSSKRRGQALDIHKSYTEAGIFNGDILYLK